MERYYLKALCITQRKMVEQLRIKKKKKFYCVYIANGTNIILYISQIPQSNADHKSRNGLEALYYNGVGFQSIGNGKQDDSSV